MSGLLDLAARLERAAERIPEITANAIGEVVGEEMLQDFEDHRDTGKAAETLKVEPASRFVDFTTQHYRQFFGRFRRGIPKRTMARARALAAERIDALLRGLGL